MASRPKNASASLPLITRPSSTAPGLDSQSYNPSLAIITALLMFAVRPAGAPYLQSSCRKIGECKNARSRRHPRPPKEARLGDKAHLLIVDDEANTLASLARAFRLAGHEATVCDNAARALEW